MHIRRSIVIPNTKTQTDRYSDKGSACQGLTEADGNGNGNGLEVGELEMELESWKDSNDGYDIETSRDSTRVPHNLMLIC